MAKQLVYVVNNATFEAAGGEYADEIRIGDGSIIAARHRIWVSDGDVSSTVDLDWAAVRERVTKAATACAPEQLFVVGHTPAFRPLVSEDDAPQRRIPAAEEQLSHALPEKRPSKIIVCAFRNVAASSVNDALSRIATQPPDVLIAQLEKAVQEQGRSDTFSQLSVLKHRLIGLFVSLDLEIQARHLGATTVAVDELTTRLREKIRTGREVLGSMEKSGVPQKMLVPATNLLREDVVLRKASDARTFRSWMDDLNEALDRIRQARARAS